MPILNNLAIFEYLLCHPAQLSYFMKPIYPQFTAEELKTRIDEYFIYIKGQYRHTRVPVRNGPTKTVVKEICDRKAEPPTVSGLALFLGFNSLKDFDRYLQKGRYAKILSRAQLRMQSVYEQKLHEHYTSGPIFVLKTLLGWNDVKNTGTGLQTLNIKQVEGGPLPASNEKEVMIEEQPHPIS